MIWSLTHPFTPWFDWLKMAAINFSNSKRRFAAKSKMDFDLRQAKKYRQYQQKQGWHHEPIGQGQLVYRKLPFCSRPIGKLQHLPLPDLNELDRVAQKINLRRLYLEPLFLRSGEIEKITQAAFQPCSQPFLPTQTILLDLGPSLGQIQANFNKETRYCLRKSLTQNLVLKMGPGQSLAQSFHRQWKKTAGLKLIIPSQKSFLRLVETFDPQARVNLAYAGKNVIAGNLILIANQTAYYYYAFANRSGRKKYAGYRLVWEAIRWAKKNGCQKLDLEGVYDPFYPQKNWRGFSHFKRSFGGQLITYPGCWQKKYPATPRLHK